MGRSVAALAILLGVLGSLGAGCDGCGAGEPPATSASSAASASAVDVPAVPERLAAHVVIAPPATSWPALVEAMGDAAKGWPRSFATALVGEVGLPITAAEHVSTDAAVPLVVLADGAGGIDVVAAFHLRAVDRVEVLATGGESARFRAERGDAGFVRLLPARPGDVPRMHLALVGNHLVAATSDAALLDAAAFVARANGPSLPDGALAVASLGSSFAVAARPVVERLVRSAPPLPGGLTPGGSELGPLLEALAGGRAEIRADGAAIEVVVVGAPSLAATGAALASPQGPAAPWLALPASSTLAVAIHTSAADRAAEASRAAEGLADALGLVATRRVRFGAALQELARARSSAVAFALGTTPEGPAAWFRAGLEDGDAAERALQELASAAGKKAGDGKGASLTGKATVIERVGEAVRLKVRAEATDGEGTAVDVLVRREGDALLGAVGTDAAAALQLLRGAAAAEASLASRPLARRVAAAAPTHALLAFADLAGPGRAPSAPPAGGTTVAVSVSLAGGPRITAVAEPRALAAVRAKLGALPP